MSIRHLDALLAPESVALVGASDRAGSVGAALWRALRDGGFRGALHAVNRRAQVLDGVPAAARVADLPAAPDLALVCTPPASVPALVAQLAERGCRAVVVVSDGLDGDQRRAMLDAARPTLLRVLGPDSLGLAVPALGLNACLVPGGAFRAVPADALAPTGTLAPAGTLALVAPSGALVSALVDWARGRGIGFSRIVALGDEADIDAADLLDWLASDPATRAILLCLDRVGSARKFMSAARAAGRNKPVVVLPLDREPPDASADGVLDAAIRRAGLLRVDSLHELCFAAETLLRWQANRAEALTLVGNGGGALRLAAGAAARAGLVLHRFDDATRQRLVALLPAGAVPENPLDIGDDADAALWIAVLRALQGTPAGDAVLLLHAPSVLVDAGALARALVPLAQAATPLAAPWLQTCWLGGPSAEDPRHVFDAAGLPHHATPEAAIRAIAQQHRHRHNQAELLETPPAQAAESGDPESAAAQLRQALAGGPVRLDGAPAHALLAAAGVALDAGDAMPLAAGDPRHLAPGDPPVSDPGREPAIAPGAPSPATGPWRVGTDIDPVFGPVLWFGRDADGAPRTWALPPLNPPLAQALLRQAAPTLDGPPAPPAADGLVALLVQVSQALAQQTRLVSLRIAGLAWRGAALTGRAALALDDNAAGGAGHFAILPYPLHWVETVPWRGRSLTLRPIRPEDEPQHLAFLATLSPEDIRLRVFYSRRSIEHSELARLTQIDYARELAFVATVPTEPGDVPAVAAPDAPPDGPEQTLGVVRAAIDPDGIAAEFGIVVRSSLKGSGLGTLLMDKLLRTLRGLGVQRLEATVLAENRPMLDMARRLGFTISPVPGEDTRAIVLALR